ncbi:MAG: Fe-S cluster assembly sulfur transfer protein SufU [Acidimicrobiales bacterium]
MANLDELYREIILDHYRSPRNRGELPSPPALRVEGFNPLCGDEITLYLDVRDGVLVDIKVAGQGCSISQSSASLMSAAVKGRSLADVNAAVERFKRLMTVHESGPGAADDTEEVDLRALGELAALQGVVKFPVRIKCATLAWNTLVQGLADA